MRRADSLGGSFDVNELLVEDPLEEKLVESKPIGKNSVIHVVRGFFFGWRLPFQVDLLQLVRFKWVLRTERLNVKECVSLKILFTGRMPF